MKKELEDLRNNYTRFDLKKSDLPDNPIDFFKEWMEVAIKSNIDEPNAMTLATATTAGVPSARIVLLKGIDDEGFLFYTNYESRKGYELLHNPNVAMVFLWKENERQVRIEGVAEKISKEASQAYFDSRPVGSRISAIASPQSQRIETYEILEDRREKAADFYKDEKAIPVPEYWGGYRVIPRAIEFWQGRPNRLHDRFRYQKDEKGSWGVNRLAP